MDRREAESAYTRSHTLEYYCNVTVVYSKKGLVNSKIEYGCNNEKIGGKPGLWLENSRRLWLFVGCVWGLPNGKIAEKICPNHEVL